MELDVAPDGRVFYIERDGRLMIWKPNTQQTVTAGTVPVTTSQENGLLGLQLAPDFAFSQWVYLFYSQLPDSTNTQIVARFKMNGDTLDLSSEQRILTFQHQRGQCCHSSGSLYFGPDGSLYISTGDNTNPVRLERLQPDRRALRPVRVGRPAHEREHERPQRQDPADQADGDPARLARARAATYTIPAGNLYPEGTAQTRPEIFSMGFRNPFRFTVDPETGWVLMGDYGPDASSDQRQPRPAGQRRVQRDHERRQLRLALLHPRQHAVQRLRLRDLDVGPQVRLREPHQHLAQQHGPDEPSARPRRDRVDGLQRPGSALHADARHRRRPDGRPALPLRPDARRRRASSRRSMTTSGSSPSGTTAGSRPPT